MGMDSLVSDDTKSMIVMVGRMILTPLILLWITYNWLLAVYRNESMSVEFFNPEDIDKSA